MLHQTIVLNLPEPMAKAVEVAMEQELMNRTTWIREAIKEKLLSQAKKYTQTDST